VTGVRKHVTSDGNVLTNESDGCVGIRLLYKKDLESFLSLSLYKTHLVLHLTYSSDYSDRVQIRVKMPTSHTPGGDHRVFTFDASSVDPRIECMYHYRRRGETEEQLQRRYEEYRAICAVCTYQTPEEAERMCEASLPKSGAEALRMVESRLSACTLAVTRPKKLLKAGRKRPRSGSADTNKYVLRGPVRDKVRRLLEESLKSDALKRAEKTVAEEREKRIRADTPEDFDLFLEATADVSPADGAEEWKEPTQWQERDDSWIEDLLSSQNDADVEPDSPPPTRRVQTPSPTDLFCFETIPDTPSPAVAVVEPYRPEVVEISDDEQDDVTLDDRLLVSRVSSMEHEQECRKRVALWSRRVWSARRDKGWPRKAVEFLEMELEKAKSDLADAVVRSAESEGYADAVSERCADYDEMAEKAPPACYPVFTFGKSGDAPDNKKIRFRRVVTPGHFKK